MVMCISDQWLVLEIEYKIRNYVACRFGNLVSSADRADGIFGNLAMMANELVTIGHVFTVSTFSMITELHH
jgi:hypothetical protein